MAIQIRDIEKRLFSYLFLNKVATSDQIQRDIYPSISHQALYKRLNRLIKARFIDASYHRELNGRLVYTLAPKAMTDFVIGKATKEIRKQMKSNSVLHDLDLVNLRSRFKTLPKVERYYTENLIQSGVELEEMDQIKPLRGFHFDAILKVKGANRCFLLPLEYERSIKFSSRYIAYFKKVYANPQVEAVLFLAGTAKLSERVKAIEQSVIGDRWPKVFHSVFKDSNSNQDLNSFINLRGEKIVLE